MSLIGQEADVAVARRDESGALRKNVSIDEALVKLSDETPDMNEGDMMMEDEMMDEPSGMMAPPDGMDDMISMDSAMDEMPMDEMPEQEDDDEEEEQTALMMSCCYGINVRLKRIWSKLCTGSRCRYC